MNKNTDDSNRFDNKCRTCGTWSVDNDGGSYASYGYGVRKWTVDYWCVNCGNETSRSTEDEENGDGIEDGDTV